VIHIAAEKQNRVNEEINVPEVRLIGADGEQIGITKTSEALTQADEVGLDLVEIVPTSEPPVCRVMDFGKFLFELSKKKHAAKRKQKHIQIKEIKFRPGTEEGDYQVKLKSIIKFLSNGDKVKITLRFRGREMAHKELGTKMLEQVEQDLQEFGVIEQEKKLEGRQMIMVMASKK